MYINKRSWVLSRVPFFLPLIFFSLQLQANSVKFSKIDKVTGCKFEKLTQNILSKHPEFPICLITWVNQNRQLAGKEFLRQFEQSFLKKCERTSNMREDICRLGLAKEIEAIRNRLNSPVHISKYEDKVLALNIFADSVIKHFERSPASHTSTQDHREKEFLLDITDYIGLLLIPKKERNQDLEEFLRKRITENLK